MKRMQVVGGLMLAAGASSEPRVKASAGVFGRLGLISDWLSTGFTWTNEGASTQLIFYPLKTGRFSMAIGAGGQYFGYAVRPFSTVCMNVVGSTIVPYAGLRYGTSELELSLSEYG